MKRGVALFVLGVLLGLLAGAGGTYYALTSGRMALPVPGRVPAESPSVCYSCLWDGYDPALRTQVVEFYRQYTSPDPFLQADARYILWRATGTPSCDSRNLYRQAADSGDPYRSMQAWAVYGFSGPECGWDGSGDLNRAADAAEKAGLASTARQLRAASRNRLNPELTRTEIQSSLTALATAETMILGATTIEVPPAARVGTQVHRVARDWISFQMRWDLTSRPLPAAALVDYHEGKLVKNILALSAVEVYPLAGALVARRGDTWYAADETGVFRFAVVGDKLQYPTTHVSGSAAWIVDTFGLASVAAQGVERKMQVVIGSMDTESDALAAFYLASRGVSVVFPSDRFQDMLLGYEGAGVLLGTAPVKRVGDNTVIGGQPIPFSRREKIIVEDADADSAAAAYDAPARYFRRLGAQVSLNLEYVPVQETNQIERVLGRANQIRATAVAVRVETNYEFDRLREWLKQSPDRRAILFNCGLYPHAQALFTEFPKQVTFGDLRPRFE
ncbi:MAG TPA: hypothetical protein VNN18_09310 [Candidatus Xenobia bacterium]|nr:hypothetical protein [Candidatus Xenobia bacterium]